MASLADIYIDTVWRDLRADASFPPQTRLAPGDYGIWTAGVFSRAGNVAELPGWSGSLRPTFKTSAVAQSFFMSSDVTLVTFAAKANLQWPPSSSQHIVTAGASVQVDFSANNAVWANYGNAKIVDLDNKVQIMNELLRRARDLSSNDPEWWDHSKFRVVTQILATDRFTIALSRSSKSSLVVEANAEAVDWGSGSINTSVTHQSGAFALWEGAPSADSPYTPQFKASHVVVTGPAIHHWVDDDGPGD